MDKLEEFIKENRDELDRYNPSPDIWKGISKSTGRGKFYYVKWISAAAMVTIIFATAAFHYYGERKRAAIEFQSANNHSLEKSIINETEYYYDNQVKNLIRQASPVLTKYPEIEKELVVDMAHIDSICMDIKRDLKDNISNQEVIEALINNYRLKIKILEDMLTQLNGDETENLKKNGHEI